MTTDKMHDWEISYWQIGCNDAKAGRSFNMAMQFARGYEQGYYFGQHGRGMPAAPQAALFQSNHALQPDPPLKNPYMESIEAIEGIMTRMNTFHSEFPSFLKQRDAYLTDLLRIRDELHAMRLDEMADETFSA